MAWVEETKTEKYWIPEVEPENTDDWQTQQMRKSYLKPDGSRTGHPKWFFNNGAYASDEYLYHNYEWYTIEEGDKLDSENGKYIVKETPESEWEKFDTYKIRPSYKRYLYNKTEKPAFQFGQTIQHSHSYDDATMTVSDVYTVSNWSNEQLESEKIEFLTNLRSIRDFILKETDYITSISVERNLVLSQEFIDYRQALRDIPQQFYSDAYDTLTEDDYNKILSIAQDLRFSTESNVSLENINISFFPQMPTNSFI